MAITVVGSVALDTIETPFDTADNVLGGAASYFTIAAALYDAVNLVAVVGEDFPDKYLRLLRSRNIDLRGLRTAPGTTFRWGGKYRLDLNTRDTLFTELGVFAAFHPDVPEAYRGAEIVFLANILPQLQLDVLRQTGESAGAQIRALDTMNLWIETAKDDLLDVMRRVDIVLIAEEEVRQLSETPSLRAGVKYILELGPKLLVVKQGSYGALLFSRDGEFFAAPAYPLEEVRDPTGAGDAFAGGFLGYLSSRLSAKHPLTWSDYKRALIHGNIMGSYTCEAFGVARLESLTREQVEARYREFVRFTHFEGEW
ncbi:MAG TPA: PfkB family carbohydrate kinase [Ktedonobacterales bacterium]|nr:PfkB family carbohydrate kinase [Ktedonobacterales bacterium]